MSNYNTIIIGAGAAGLMCAWQAAKRGKSVTLIEHTRKIGEKIRISGGGRCNFTNLYSTPDNFISQNPHFCKSALARFTPHDFIALLDDHKIAWHEKPYEEKTGNENARGQLFCDNSAKDIIDMLRENCNAAGVQFATDTKVTNIERKENETFEVQTSNSDYICNNLVIASGGLSIPKIGASNFGYEVAKKFDLKIVPPLAALVPLTFDEALLEKTKPLAGISVDASVSCNGATFREGLLITHRGLSGPSILQISSYWKKGEAITINLAPDLDTLEYLKKARDEQPKKILRTVISGILPSRMLPVLFDSNLLETKIAELSNNDIQSVSESISAWKVYPIGTEGYRTAEVTLGGIDTRDVSSKNFNANTIKNLYFIGEVLDVTGHLGGHNFQWAWASGWCAGNAIE